ncbi:metallophosphoesterase family protein [Polyangium aurulentum]|uniref:metallophosphoesterase family protein n=1 Tax=Polyangium aurulentum TaxID=2567896 RepID=UPI00200C58DB|nr:metallophosphoesterase [Polyangium aurulentum]UQA61171.1 metallophosphoesterase [Polyangium aurulentum]
MSLHFPFPDEFDFRRGARIAVVGDVQRTGLIEFWREQNDAERARIVRAIVEEAPALLITLGDHVFDGSSARDWARFDALFAPVREARLPVLPVVGNHDLWPRGALRHYFDRFRHLDGARFHARKVGPLGLVALDSNRFWLSPQRWEEQRQWLAGVLDRFDGDPGLRGVLALVHHPPYTNSTVASPSIAVEHSFLPAFLRARKTLAMLSGHVHAYEHFAREGRHFLVSGGGGGPRHSLSPPERHRFPDLFAGPSLRDFHYLLLEPGDEGLLIRARGLAKGADEIRPLDEVFLPWRSPA